MTSLVARTMVFLCFAGIGFESVSRAGEPPEQARRKLTATELAREIDRLIQHRLDAAAGKPAPRSSDAEFLRRAYLDIAGVIPAADQVVPFLENQEPDKRARLIDELSASPRYGRHLADIWQHLLVERDGINYTMSFQPLHNWLGDRFNSNQPWDQLVRDLLSASGTQAQNPAVTFFLAGPAPERITDQVSQLFLGIQLKCAQCHNHPFSSWKRSDYWGMAAFFTPIRYVRGKPSAAPTAASENGPGKANPFPESYVKLPAAYLQGEQAVVENDASYRPAFARWLTTADNPFFARAMANRLWGHFFGRGIVQPVDNLIDDNEPSHPELLALLAEQFAANGFDLKYLVRAICASEAYQRSAAVSEADPKWFGHMPIKALSPEQLYDSLVAVIGEQGRPAGRGRPGMAVSQREAFVEFFKTDGAPNATEYEAGIPQALRLMNGTQLSSRNITLLKQVTGLPPAQGAEKLYLATLARRPSSAETARFSAVMSRHPENPEPAYSALLWALINCSEFSLNH